MHPDLQVKPCISHIYTCNTFSEKGSLKLALGSMGLGEHCVSLVCSQLTSLERQRDPFPVNGL